MASVNVSIDTADTASYVKSKVFWGNEFPTVLLLVKNFISGILGGTYKTGRGTITIGDVTATATVTIGAGDFANNDTITINGIAFTAKTSGATGNQFNIGASLAETAANLVKAINNSSTALIKQTVYASSSGAVVTLTARLGGAIGNVAAGGGLYTLAKSAANVTLTTTFSGGTSDTVYGFDV